MPFSADRLALLLGTWDGGEGPRWRRLADRLDALVQAGTLADDLQLPTERALARRLGLGRGTVAAAYDELGHRGLAVSRQGSGSRVRRPAGAPPGPRGTSAMFATLGGSPEGTIDLSLAETRCIEGTRAAIAAIDPRWVTAHVDGTGYLPAGLPALRAALAGWLQHRGLPATADSIVVTVGAQQAISITTQVLCPAGSAVLVEEATYPGALEVFRRLGLRVVSIPGDGGGPDPSALEALAARLRPAMVYLIPVGNNPTGMVLSPARLDALAAVLARTGTPVLDDRTPAPLAPPALNVPHLATRLPAGQVVTVGSASKVAWAGLRTGWLVGAPGFVREAVAARIAADLAPPLTSQALVAALVPHLDVMAEQARAEVAKARRAAIDELASRLPDGVVAPTDAGAWLWLQLPGADAVRLTETAERHGVLVTAGPVFSAEGRLRDRLRIATVAEPAEVRTGIQRLTQAWEASGDLARPRREAAMLVI
jgi:DNA-binding transcriptional MocR family regulator